MMPFINNQAANLMVVGDHISLIIKMLRLLLPNETFWPPG